MVREGDLLIGDVAISWSTLAGDSQGQAAALETAADSVRYQVLRTVDGAWSYGRIAEERRGTLSLPGGRNVGVLLRPRSRNHPFYSADDSRLYLDVDGDGEIATSRSVTRSGRPAAAEEIDPDEPFFLEGRAWRVSRIDSTGDHLVLVGTDVEVAAAEGFEAPAFGVTGLDGTVLSDDALRGSPVLIEFWSIACSYSEAVRSELNALARRFADEGLVRISVAREDSSAEVLGFLEDHPRTGTVVAGAGRVWERFNSDVVTPAFYLIDREGVIRFRGRGTRGVEGLEAATARMVEGDAR